MIVTIDGPAGAGKSTVSKELAKMLGFIYLDSGAMYRACALHMLRKGVDIEDEGQIKRHLDELSIMFRDDKIFLNSEDVSGLIRTPEIDMAASRVSRIREVRLRLTEIQQSIAQDADVVAEGRDMGTVVFPDAEFKFFLTASLGERAKRRKLQLERSEGKDIVPYETILQQIKNRDKFDSLRELAPLKPADEAVVIDSTNLSANEVTKYIINFIEKRKQP